MILFTISFPCLRRMARSEVDGHALCALPTAESGAASQGSLCAGEQCNATRPSWVAQHRVRRGALGRRRLLSRDHRPSVGLEGRPNAVDHECRPQGEPARPAGPRPHAGRGWRRPGSCGRRAAGRRRSLGSWTEAQSSSMHGDRRFECSARGIRTRVAA
jgi:hypothetical protein